MSDLKQNIHTVFLPAFAELEISDAVAAFLRKGCRAILPGETRDEYVAREMTNSRIAAEKPEGFLEFAAEARSAADGPVLIAVDQEMAGIQRLHKLVPPLPTYKDLSTASPDAVETAASAVAAGAKAIGVNMFLSPIVDVVTGYNPWLDRRTISTDPNAVASFGAAFVRGVQKENVVCTAKHFPGHHDVTADPAIDATAVVKGNVDDLAPGYGPFEAAIASGTKAIMTGPMPVPCLDADESASTSASVISMLRNAFGFDGLIVSDDLDNAAVMRGKSVAEKAVDALAAGSDLLLVAASEHLPELAEAVADAVADGRLPVERVNAAAERVRATVSWANV